MNPPGGISLLVHILIIIFGSVKRAFRFVLRKLGLEDSPPVRTLRKFAGPLKNHYVQSAMSSFIIISMFTLMLFTFIILVYGILHSETNIDHIKNIVKFIKKI